MLFLAMTGQTVLTSYHKAIAGPAMEPCSFALSQRDWEGNRMSPEVEAK